ncbi:uncharacterized protein RJT20DRAFT_129904 [Scheffersomyces xylosifermentans]|uniref:uncharacterized protein n=1 Tax=Scheffersomyces xylosifermentans TaxID=1304137 RepID=UPI00315D9853
MSTDEITPDIELGGSISMELQASDYLVTNTDSSTTPSSGLGPSPQILVGSSSDAPPPNPALQKDPIDSGSDSDSDSDDYIVSDDEDLNVFLNSSSDHHISHVTYPTSISDHANYLSNTLSHALNSLELDKSLVLQAQISGKLNNQNQNVVEKRNELLSRLKALKELYNENFVVKNDSASASNLSKVEQMKRDLAGIESRIARLKGGNSKGTSYIPFLRTTHHSQIGVAKKYPIEFNQAKSKVLERQIEEDF